MHIINKSLFFLSTILLLSYSAKTQNQVTVTAIVFPPYSTDFSYYIDNPNKIKVTFLNTTNQPLDVYIEGRLTGDNGIEIKTDPSWHPSLPVTLYPGVPFQLTEDNIGDIFSSDHLLYVGTSEEELIRLGGLPEGNYQFCFSVFDFNTGNRLSGEDMGCSNIITITYIDPPVILSPVCGDTIVAMTPQNILISWSTPVGGGPNIKYRFIMVEMHPDNRNPNDALASSTPPYFLEKDDLTIPQLLIGPSDPPLVEGRSYAFMVQAYDPDNLVIFNNNGTSEACWFNYKHPTEIQTFDSIMTTDFVLDDFINDFELIPNTKISGTIHYKLASLAQGGTTTGSQTHATYQGDGNAGNSSQGENYSQTGSNSSSGGNSANYSHFGFNFIDGFQTTSPTAGIVYKPPFGTGTINESVYSINNAEPLRNTTLRLVARFSYKGTDGFNVTRESIGGLSGVNINDLRFFDLNGKEVPATKVLTCINQVLDVCTTDDKGNFSFDFPTDFFTGPVYMVSSGKSFGDPDYKAIVSLKIEVENQKFCSPDVDIFAKTGDDIQLEPQIALIKDYDLHLTVLSAYDEDNGDSSQFYKPHDTHPKSIPGGDPIPNATVKVLRDMQKLGNEHPAILMAEGGQLGSTTEDENGSFKDVFIGKTDVHGEIVIPHLVEHWAITDGENNSPYFFSIRNRNENVDNTYENTMYNFEPWFGTINGLRINSDGGGPTQMDDDAGYSYPAPVVYNHFYVPPQTASDRKVYLMAAKPEIKGRLMTVSNMENVPVKYGIIHLYEQMCENCNHAFYDKGFTMPNDAGFFRFTNLSVNTDEDLITRGPYRRIYFEHSLYKSFYWPPLDQKALNLRYGDLFFKEFQVEPKQKLQGEVVDDAGNPIACYVRTLPDGPYVKTEPRWEYDNSGNIYKSAEVFETVAGSNTNHIEIQPLSNSYFTDTFEVVNPDFTKIHTFKVYRKLHRLKIQLYNNETDGVISNATVLVGDTLAEGHTNSAGIAEIEFTSPGEQFLVRVFAENYSPMQEVYNIPVSKQWQEETLRMHYSLHISGTVTELSGGQPIDSALIYTELQNTDGNTLFIQTYSDANGQYRLDGIPWYTTPTDIEVHAVKPGKNPSYIGQNKTVTVKNTMIMSGYDFQLKVADGWDLSNIWGFPVTVEKMIYRVQAGTRISGYFYNLPAHSDFNINSSEKVYFKNLKVTKGGNGEIIPDGNSVFTESYTLPIKIKGGFQGDLFIGNTMQNNTHLAVNKDGDNGLMKGALKLDLASFGFAYDFSGDFYIGDDTTSASVTVFKSNIGGQSGENTFNQKRHYIFDCHNEGGLQPVAIDNFRVYGFNASSSFSRAYLENGMIHIGTILHTDISMPNNGQPLDLKIDAGEIQITQNNMDMVHNPNDELSFDLEKWKVVSKNGWVFDKTLDAIVIPNGNIITGLGVDIGIKNLKIRPTALREGKVDMSKGLNLGGIKKLTLAPDMEPRFNYDAGVGHYRISMVGTALGPVAWVDNLPATPDRLEFTSIGMLSDNSTVLSLGKTMRFHNLMDIFVDQIMTGDGFFRLGGMPDLGIPGYVPTRAEVTYTKENGNLKFSLEPLSGGVDCNANITYTLEQNKNRQTLTNKHFVAYGTFNINPPPGETGDKLRIQGVLTKTPTECFIDVIHPQTIKMGKESFDIIDGKISVVNGSWNELNYTAHTHSEGLDDKNVLAFTVHGGLEANGDGIKADSIKTPLGNLNIAYLFPESALVGNLTIKKKVEMGFASINSGMMASRFDPHGFYIAFFGDVTMTAQNYLGGFIMGVYDSDLTPVCQTFLSPFRKNPPNLTSLHGLYVIGQRKLADYSFFIPVTPPLFVTFKAGLGAYVHLDYSDPTVVVGGYAYVDATGGYWVPMCSYVGVSANIFLDISGGYQNDVFFLKSCGEVKVGVKACGIEGGLELVNKIKLDSKGNNEFDLGFGNCDNY